jgi:hypothetical protein
MKFKIKSIMNKNLFNDDIINQNLDFHIAHSQSIEIIGNGLRFFLFNFDRNRS